MRQKNIREALRKWDGMTLYGLTSRGYQNLPSRLSSILQADVPKSYYLSSRACLGILRRASARGKELPEIARDLTGSVEDYDSFFSALEKVSPVPVAFEDILGSSHGYYSLVDKRIAVREGMSEPQTLKTLIHEIAHAKLHDFDIKLPPDEHPQIDRQTREVQAESVAYCVCQRYGLDTSDYSFGYIGGWSSGWELKELKASLEIIRDTAAEIIDSVDKQLMEMRQEEEISGPVLAM